MRLYNQGVRRPRLLTVFTPEEDALLGTDVDRVIAERIGTTTSAVSNRRKRLNIPPHKKRGRPRTNRSGYVTVVLAPDDPFVEMTRKDRRVKEHRLVMAHSLGRPLTQDEFVHHRNGIKNDNNPDNLELWTRSHPDGQRVQDVFEWCVAFIERYAREIDDTRNSIFDRTNPA